MEHSPAGGDEARAEEGKQFRSMSFFGQNRADERHSVRPEQRSGEVFQGAREVADGRAGIDGRLSELKRVEGGGGEVGFGGPAAVDGGFACPRFGGDGVERHARVALFGEEAEGGLENTNFRFGVARATGGAGGSDY